jgi:hypothetical protein
VRRSSGAGRYPASVAADWDAATYDRIAGPQARWGTSVVAFVRSVADRIGRLELDYVRLNIDAARAAEAT